MFLMITLCVINSTSAVFFSGEVLKPTIVTKDDVTIIILGEFHNDITPGNIKTKEQRTDLLAFSKENNAFLIIEDSAAYTGSDELIKSYVTDLAENQDKDPISVIAGLSKLCTEKNISNVSAECRYMLMIGAPLESQIKADKQFITTLKTCINNPLYQKYIQEAIEEYDFYIKQLLNKQSSRSFWQNLKSSISDLQSYHFKAIASQKMLNLNIICELNKVLESRKHSVIIIGVGVNHMQNISEMIQNIFNFKVALRKNLTRDIPMFGSSGKMNEIHQKKLSILKEYALDLPQFFDEALKAQPIRSRL